MSKLNTETIELLDKVYNLRSKESVILVKMDEEMEQAASVYDETSAIKNDLEDNINRLNNEVEVLSDEGERLKNVLNNIDEKDYAEVLETLKIDFHPDEIKSKLDSLLPVTVNGLVSDIKMSSHELSRVEEKLDETKTEMEDLNIRKEEALVNQNRLNHYFDMALSSNMNATREELTGLFEGFDFNGEEARECAKLLMFPEDGLFEYEKEYKNSAKERAVKPAEEEKDYSESFELESINDNEAPITFIEAEEIDKDDDVVESKVVEEEPAIEVFKEKEEEPITEIEKEEPIIEKFENVEEPVLSSDEPVLEDLIVEATEPVEEVVKPTREEVSSYLTELGFDTLDFTSNDIEKIINNYDKEQIRDNVNVVKENGINVDVFADNIELLYDKEMKSKIDKLTSVGKLPQDIYLNPSVLTKYNLTELDSAIKTLEDSGLEPKNVPLMAY